LTGGITVGKALILDYSTLENYSGNNNWAGALQIGKNTSGKSVIRSSAQGSTLTLGRVSIDTDYVTDPVNTYQNLYLEGAGDITIGGIVSGDGTDDNGGYLLGHGDVVMDGTGLLTLSGVNTYSGRTIVNSGTVAVGTDESLGTAPGAATADRVIINSGTLRATASFALTATRGIALGTALGAGSGAIQVDAESVLDYAGIITDNGSGSDSLIKSGDGTLSLTGANTYFGKTTINSGTLTVNGDVCLGTAPEITTPGHLTITNGTLHATASFTLDAKRGIALGPTTESGKGTIDVDTDAVVLYGGILANNGGTGDLTKSGAGKLWLSGASTYTGATAVEAGTLSVNGSLASASAVTVAFGATLAGIGTAAGTVAESGTISAGNSIGTLSTGSETWYGGGDIVVEINDAEGTMGADPGWDWLNVSGLIDVQSTPESPFTIRFGSPSEGIVANFDCKQSYRWTIASGTSAVLNFSADKFLLDASAFRNFLGGGTLGVDLSLDGNGVDVVFTPYACQTWDTKLASAVVDGKMTLHYGNIYGLASVQAIVLSNCTLEGTAYGPGFEGGVSLGDVPLSPRIDLPEGTTNVLMIATKINGGLSATVNALSKDLCGNAKSFDPILLTLTVTDGEVPAMQDLGNLTAAERYVFIRNNDSPGMRWISLIVNGQRFEFDNVADGEIIRLDIGEALYGDNNTAVLAGSGETGAGAELIIYDSPDGSMTLSATVKEPVALGLQVNGPEVVLRWPSTGSGFVFVQERESLTSGEWKTLPNATRELNGEVSARVTKEGSCKLYRLFKP
jgi:autotransporter-associated beta strand protein